MSSSSSAFIPLEATAPVPTQRSRREQRRGFVPSAQVRDAVAARFVPLVDAADEEAASMAGSDQARAAGFAAGFAAGSREAARVAAAEAQAARRMAADAEQARSAEHDHALAVLAGAARAVRNREVPVLERAEAALHAGALELAEAVLGVELSDAPTAARAALARVQAADVVGDIVVRMHPRDVEAVAMVPDGVRLVADARLNPGDAVAEHADGELDARIASALGRARAVLGATTGARHEWA